MIIHTDAPTGRESDPGAKLRNHVADLTAGEEATESSLETLGYVPRVDEGNAPTRFTEVARIGLFGVGGKESPDIHGHGFAGLTNQTAKARNNGPGIHHCRWTEPTSERSTLPAIFAHTAKASYKRDGTFFGRFWTFIHWALWVGRVLPEGTKSFARPSACACTWRGDWGGHT